jgi:GNAT superfamily N-acetyltransferase
MSPLETFQRYRADRRARPIPGYTMDVFPDLCRHSAQHTGLEGFVGFAELDPVTAGGRIDEQIRHFERLGQSFEWKIYDYDQPASLKSLLEARGFSCGEAEAFLVADLEAWTETPARPSEVRVKRISDPPGIRDIVTVAEAVWPEAIPGSLERFVHDLETAPDRTSFYCAYLAGRPVAAGRIELPTESKFASLWGGGVLTSVRGRGVYSALLAVRLAEAKDRGYRFVTVDAEPMSRPILLRKGFQHVCWTYPMRRGS